jgi:hypothetical protein
MNFIKRPGDIFLDRYLPNAAPEKREEARKNLYDFVTILLRIATRRADEENTSEIRAKSVGAVESDFTPKI